MDFKMSFIHYEGNQYIWDFFKMQINFFVWFLYNIIFLAF